MTSSQRKRRDWDYTRSYSYWSEPPPRPVDLPFVASWPAEDGMQPGIPMSHTEWCRDHCRYAWAWWFDEEFAYMGFSDQNEFMLYRLSHQ